jgi:hypothetical protein
MEKLRIIPLAVAFGAVWAFGMLFLAWAAAFGWGTALVELMGSLYIGYGASFLGGIIGALWAFVDGAIAGALIALIYNVVARTQKAT